MIRFGMHSSLWTSAWTREGAERSVSGCARHGLQVVEIALLDPDIVDVQHSLSLFERHGVAPTASLCLPQAAEATRHPEAARTFLTHALDVAHALGCNTLCGVTYSTLGYRSGAAPTEAEYEAIARALKPVARRAADYGMTLGLEACNRYETHLINTAAQARALAERIDEPAVMIHLDTYHANIEEKSFADALADGGGLCAMSISRRATAACRAPATSHWHSVMTALKGVAFLRRPGDEIVRHLDARARRRALGMAAGRQRSRRSVGSRRPLSQEPRPGERIAVGVMAGY